MITSSHEIRLNENGNISLIAPTDTILKIARVHHNASRTDIL